MAQARTMMPSMNGASRSMRGGLAGGEEVGAGEHGDGYRTRSDPGGRLQLVWSERVEGPPQEDHGHDDEVEHESEREGGEDRELEQL